MGILASLKDNYGWTYTLDKDTGAIEGAKYSLVTNRIETHTTHCSKSKGLTYDLLKSIHRDAALEFIAKHGLDYTISWANFPEQPSNCQSSKCIYLVNLDTAYGTLTKIGYGNSSRIIEVTKAATKAGFNVLPSKYWARPADPWGAEQYLHRKFNRERIPKTLRLDFTGGTEVFKTPIAQILEIGSYF